MQNKQLPDGCSKRHECWQEQCASLALNLFYIVLYFLIDWNSAKSNAIGVVYRRVDIP